MPPHLGQGAGQGTGSCVLKSSPQPSQRHSVLCIRWRTTASGGRPNSSVSNEISSSSAVVMAGLSTRVRVQGELGESGARHGGAHQVVRAGRDHAGRKLIILEMTD